MVTRLDYPLPGCRQKNRRGGNSGAFIPQGPLVGGGFHPGALISEDRSRVTAKANRTTSNKAGRRRNLFWVHNRWKTPKPYFLLTHYKRGLYLPPEMPAKALKPFRILIRGGNWLGDSVISMPAVRAIKAGRPDAHITIAAPEKIAAAWRLVPEVDEIISLTSGSLFGAVGLIRRQPRFDAAVLFPNSLRTALEVWLARVPRRIGYRAIIVNGCSIKLSRSL